MSLTDEQRGVIRRSFGSAHRCREDATLFRAAGERARCYAYGGDEFGDMEEDPEMVAVVQALRTASAKAEATARTIDTQTKELPGYDEYCKELEQEMFGDLKVPESFCHSPDRPGD